MNYRETVPVPVAMVNHPDHVCVNLRETVPVSALLVYHFDCTVDCLFELDLTGCPMSSTHVSGVLKILVGCLFEVDLQCISIAVLKHFIFLV